MGRSSAANLSGRWVARSSAQKSFALRWDIVDRGGQLSGLGANRKYSFSGTGTAGGAVSLHFVFPTHTNDFTGTVDAPRHGDRNP